MKTILIILFLFSFLFGFSQSEDLLLKCRSFPKGTNVITINTSDTIDVAFKKIANIILDYGFTISNSDKELFYINTNYAGFSNNSFKTKISIRLKYNPSGGTSIKLKGEASNLGYNFPAYNFHRKDVPNRAFAHMLGVATSYENVEIFVSTD